VKWGSALLVLLVAFLVYFEGRSPRISLETFASPPFLVAEGFTEAAVLRQIADQIERIRDEASTSAPQRAIALQHGDTSLDVVVPTVGLSLRTLLQHLREVGGDPSTRVSGEIVALRPPRTAQKWRLHMRVQGRQAISLRFDPTDADSAFRQAAEYVVRESEPIILAAYYYSRGAFDRAETTVRHCLTRICAVEDSAQLARGYNLLGLIALARYADTTGGVQYFAQASAIDPGLPHPHANLGAVWALRGNLDRMRQEFAAATRLDPELPFTHEAWGLAWMRLRQPDSALPELRAAIRLNPAVAAPYYNLGLVFEQHGEFDSAATYWAQALLRDTTRIVYYQKLGAVLLKKLKRPSGAATIYARAARIFPNDPDPMFWSAKGYELAGLADSAAHRYSRVACMQPDTGYTPAQVSSYRKEALASIRKLEEAHASVRIQWTCTPWRVR
jgi:tetratricopeptide (TPR) repeat protein